MRKKIIAGLLTVSLLYGSSLTAKNYAALYSRKYVDRRLSNGKATIPYASYTYRGRGIKPSVTVRNSAGDKLKKETDYTVSYSDNTKIGTAAITVTGKGKYTGTLKKTFKVKALDLSTRYGNYSDVRSIKVK